MNLAIGISQPRIATDHTLRTLIAARIYDNLSTLKDRYVTPLLVASNNTKIKGQSAHWLVVIYFLYCALMVIIIIIITQL